MDKLEGFYPSYGGSYPSGSIMKKCGRAIDAHWSKKGINMKFDFTEKIKIKDALEKKRN